MGDEFQPCRARHDHGRDPAQPERQDPSAGPGALGWIVGVRSSLLWTGQRVTRRHGARAEGRNDMYVGIPVSHGQATVRSAGRQRQPAAPGPQHGSVCDGLRERHNDQPGDVDDPDVEEVPGS